jgi:hypothetical protein
MHGSQGEPATLFASALAITQAECSGGCSMKAGKARLLVAGNSYIIAKPMPYATARARERLPRGRSKAFVSLKGESIVAG